MVKMLSEENKKKNVQKREIGEKFIIATRMSIILEALPERNAVNVIRGKHEPGTKTYRKQK